MELSAEVELKLEDTVGSGSLKGILPPVEATNELEESSASVVEEGLKLEDAVGEGSLMGIPPPVEATNELVESSTSVADSIEDSGSVLELLTAVELETPVPPREVKLEGGRLKPSLGRVLRLDSSSTSLEEDKSELGAVGCTSLLGMPMEGCCPKRSPVA